jgi:serine/threonine protein kinase
MSPEQLERLAYSQASDVFAFGVLLFEIFAREQPWAGFANVNVMAKVARGERMQPPDGVPPAVAQLMRDAWAHDAAARPKMSAVRERLLAAK